MARGRVIKVECRCGQLLFKYYKGGRGRLIKCYLDEIRKDRLKLRDVGVSDFKNALNLYNEVLRGWLIRCVKTPILTIIK